MRIGLDLDNTLACYDATFASLAAGEPELPAAMPRTKLGLRDHLRGAGREARWTELQGEAYGPGMRLARPFPGALDFIGNARAAGHRVLIISQRSPRPFAGEPYDLHASARCWIAEHLCDATGALFGTDEVFFETDRDAKVARIAACACDAFVDDLPEVLVHPSFPTGALRFLFAPRILAPASLGLTRAGDAQDMAAVDGAGPVDGAAPAGSPVRRLERWDDFVPWSRP